MRTCVSFDIRISIIVMRIKFIGYKSGSTCSYLNEQTALKQKSDASRGVYVFSDLNPYVGRPNPLKEGQELFRKGLLSEAVLALEAEVLKNPDNAEGWRLLGIAHAENDDDQQVDILDLLPLFSLRWTVHKFVLLGILVVYFHDFTTRYS